MATWMGYITGRQDKKVMVRDAIVALRQQLAVLAKKDHLLQQNIEAELHKAKANVVSNKAVATAALRRKKDFQVQMERVAGHRSQLELQLEAIESANLNAETLKAMKKAADVLKAILGNPRIDNDVDMIIETLNSQRELANEVSEAIVNASGRGYDIDETDLAQELADLESEEINVRLMGANHAPIGSLGEASRIFPDAVHEDEDDEEVQLRRLQAEMAM